MRRTLLAGAAAALLALAPLAAAPDKRDDSASEKLGIKVSLQCYTFRALTFFETVDKAAALGIKYLECYPGQTLRKLTAEEKAAGAKEVKLSKGLPDDQLAEIKKKLAEAGGLKIVAWGVDSVGGRREFEFAKKLGIEVLVTETTPSAELDKLANEFNVRLALHNHPASWPPDKVLEACAGRSKLCGSCSDTGHWMRRDLVPVEQIKKLEGRVEHLHFKDLNQFDKDAKAAKAANDRTKSWKCDDVPWGTGQGHPAAVMAELVRQGFKGYASIEYEVGSVAELMVNLPKCIAFWDKTCAELAK